jgi:NAD(P)H-dependent FMN reductase
LGGNADFEKGSLFRISAPKRRFIGLISAREAAMNIVSLLGSPRKKGNTAKVLRWVEEELEKRDHHVQRVNVLEHKINGCSECYACQAEPDEPFCALQDDAVGILNRLIAADAIIYASPLFIWSWTAQMKALLDRQTCLLRNFVDTLNPTSLIDGKRMALVMTAQGPIEGNADLLVRQFDCMARFLKATVVEHLVVPFCTTPDAIAEDIRQQAETMAAALVR